MTALISFLIVFTVVVLIHELGHFLAARAFGIPVYEFSIGFPFSPKLCTLFKSRETAFTIRLLPLGGFVSFSEDGGDGDGAEFLAEKRWKRAVVSIAGPAFNAAFAVGVIAAVYMLKGAPPVEAVMTGLETAAAVLVGTIEVISGLLSGGGFSESLSGPVGIAAIAGKAATAGFASLLYFTGILSLSLAILNLLPLPALDGGQLVVIAVEAIKGRPLAERTYGIIGAAGMAFFLILTAIVSYNDIIRLMA